MRKHAAGARHKRQQPIGQNLWLDEMVTFAAGVTAGSLGLLLASRPLFARWVHKSVRKLMTEVYERNLLELFSASSRFGVFPLAETELRAAQGKTIQRPLGSRKRLPDFDQLMFNIAQLQTMPTPLSVPVDLRVTIGPRANRPLQLDIPIMVSGMAYGWALSERAKVALALGAAAVGTATNTGQGPWLPAERQAAKKLIYQYHRGHWGKTEEIMRQADAIEIQFGQGASGGLGLMLEAKFIDSHLRQRFEVNPGEPAVAEARHDDVQRPQDLVQLVQRLRQQSGGVPIGVKLAAGQELEQDLHFALRADVDFIVLDGAVAATRGAPPILEDDFGLPTLFALVRASRYLQAHEAGDKVSLVVSGGLKTPGDYLKAIALGADAVYIGAAALLALSHTQALSAIPYEPPTQVVWYDGKTADRFDVQAGAKSLQHYLQACSGELAAGLRALGKSKLSELGTKDLFAVDRATAEICGVPLGYESISGR